MQIKYINIGPVHQIPLGQGASFFIDGEDIAVFRTRDGKIFAIENRCPHRQGPLSEGIIGGGKVICPLHGHKFDLETGRGGDGHECVQTFKIRVRDGELILEYPASLINEGQNQELETTSYGKGNGHES